MTSVFEIRFREACSKSASYFLNLNLRFSFCPVTFFVSIVLYVFILIGRFSVQTPELLIGLYHRSLVALSATVGMFCDPAVSPVTTSHLWLLSF